MIEWDEQKQLTKYSIHASVIARNVISVLNKQQPPALYAGTYEMISIANGKVGDNVSCTSQPFVAQFFFLARGIYLLEHILGAYIWGLGVLTP